MEVTAPVSKEALVLALVLGRALPWWNGSFARAAVGIGGAAALVLTVGLRRAVACWWESFFARGALAPAEAAAEE